MGAYGFESEYIANEIVPRLMLGGLNELDFILRWRPDVLVPLDRLPGSVWKSGFLLPSYVYCSNTLIIPSYLKIQSRSIINILSILSPGYLRYANAPDSKRQ